MTIFAAMKSWFTGEDIVRNLVASIVIGPIALLVVGTIAFTNTKTFIDAESAVDHQIEIRLSLKNMNIGILGAESAQRGYFLLDDTTYLAPFGAAATDATTSADTFVRLTANDPGLQARALALRSLVHDKLGQLKQTIALRQTRGIGAALGVVRNNRGKLLMDRIAAQITAASADVEHARSLAERSREARYRRSLTSWATSS